MLIRAVERSPIVISRSLGAIVSCKLAFSRFPTESKALWIPITVVSVVSILDISGMLGILWMEIETLT